jgi:hypothetical protein
MSAAGVAMNRAVSARTGQPWIMALAVTLRDFQALSQTLQLRGVDPSSAVQQAYARIQEVALRQASCWSTLIAFRCWE